MRDAALQPAITHVPRLSPVPAAYPFVDDMGPAGKAEAVPNLALLGSVQAQSVMCGSTSFYQSLRARLVGGTPEFEIAWASR